MSDEHPASQLAIDIVSDVVCPWCIIGFRQLERALVDNGGSPQVTLRWHPFELNPSMPREGQDLEEHVAEKYGVTPERSCDARQRITRQGEALGVEFCYFEGMRIYNTFDAHRLLHWALEQGRQTELELALFDAYFRRRANVSDPQVLCDVAQRIGLDRDRAKVVLDDGEYAATVREGERFWRQHGIEAVPAFVLDRRYLVMGAQGSAVFVELLRRITSEGLMHPSRQ